MTKDEVLKLALEALEEAWYHVGTFQPTEKAIDLYDEARTAIKEALAQPEQEPEWYHGIDVYGCNRFYHKTEDRTSEFNTPLYTTPPQRTWVELTDEEREEISLEIPIDAVSITEAKLRSKNT